MKTITATELKNVLAEHKFWLESNGKQGTRADLTDADLLYANLLYANLKDAILTGTILEKDKAEKRSEVASVKPESTIRSEIEAIAKKHGMKVDSIALSFLWSTSATILQQESKETKSSECIKLSVDRATSVLEHYRSMNVNDNLGDYSYLRDLITDIMHYVTEKNLGDGPEDMLIGASEVYQTEQEESEPQDWGFTPQNFPSKIG